MGRGKRGSLRGLLCLCSRRGDKDDSYEFFFLVQPASRGTRAKRGKLACVLEYVALPYLATRVYDQYDLWTVPISFSQHFSFSIIEVFFSVLSSEAFRAESVHRESKDGKRGSACKISSYCRHSPRATALQQ